MLSFASLALWFLHMNYVVLSSTAGQDNKAVSQLFLQKRVDIGRAGAKTNENVSTSLDRDLQNVSSTTMAREFVSACSDIPYGDDYGYTCQDHIDYLVDEDGYQCEQASVQVGKESAACSHCVHSCPLPGEGDVWELIGDYDIAEELEGTYMKNIPEKDVPQCMQGMVWMDQQCTTRHKLPWGYHCVDGDGFIAVDEYTTGFKWWDSNSRCVAFGRDSWTFGQARIYEDVCNYGDVVFCQTNQDTHDDPCGEGAYFELQGSQYALQKTSFGWDRISYKMFHYPLLQVIDWQGQKTKWFDDYWTVVSRRHCPLTELNCNLNHWASTNQVARCLRSIA